MIEQGRLILTMMPSLYCKLDCPHCYLTKQQRHSKDCLSLEQIKTTVEKIKRYYQQKEIHKATIDIYWYGGEPTTMGVELFSSMCTIINSTFKNHNVKHTLLSALVGVNLNQWTAVIKQYCNSKIQTSYDGLMRGKRYDKAWQKKIENCLNQAKAQGTISKTVNTQLMSEYFWIGWEGAVMRAKLTKSSTPLTLYTEMFLRALLT